MHYYPVLHILLNFLLQNNPTLQEVPSKNAMADAGGTGGHKKSSAQAQAFHSAGNKGIPCPTGSDSYKKWMLFKNFLLYPFVHHWKNLFVHVGVVSRALRMSFLQYIFVLMLGTCVLPSSCLLPHLGPSIVLLILSPKCSSSPSLSSMSTCQSSPSPPSLYVLPLLFLSAV